MSKSRAVSVTHTTITTPNTTPNKSIVSIRQICMTGILKKVPTADIAAEILKHHPESAAAKKSGKHIAWYRADMKKRGLLVAE